VTRVLVFLLLVACRAPRPPLVPSEDSRIARVEENLQPPVVIEGRAAGRPLPERMAHHGVGGVSLAVLEEGRMIWARAYGALGEKTALPTAGLGVDVPPRATPAEIAAALASLPRDAAPFRRDTSRSTVFFHPERGHGAVIMTDTDGAPPLIAEILRAIADEYGWPGFPAPAVKKTIELPPERLLEYAGDYEVGGVTIEILLDHDRLTIVTPDGATAELHPEGPDRFFLLARDSTIRFARDDAGNVIGLTAYIDGREIRAARK
jgi:hypothetical protein